jgi:hypothetical protein
LLAPQQNYFSRAGGEDPNNLNAVQQIEKGPNPDVPIGYKVIKDEFHRGSPATWLSPSDDEYDLEIQVTHIGDFELSNVDRATLDKAGVTKLVLDKVYDDYAEKAAARAHDDYLREYARP